MVNTYTLINPSIDGTFKTSVKSKNSIDAANKLYESMSEHFSNNVPEFNFTIMKGKGSNSKYYHFKVLETKKNNNVSYSVEQFQIKGEMSKMRKFNKKLEQDGGAKKRAKKTSKRTSKKTSKRRSKRKSKKLDDSSDSDSDVSVERSSPFYYFRYDPFVYDLENVYVPTFYSYASPYVMLSLN